MGTYKCKMGLHTAHTYLQGNFTKNRSRMPNCAQKRVLGIYLPYVAGPTNMTSILLNSTEVHKKYSTELPKVTNDFTCHTRQNLTQVVSSISASQRYLVIRIMEGSQRRRDAHLHFHSNKKVNQNS